MKFLMLPSKDSKTGKGHSLDKFGFCIQNANQNFVFLIKIYPNFSEPWISGQEGDVILKHASYPDLSEPVCQTPLCPCPVE